MSKCPDDIWKDPEQDSKQRTLVKPQINLWLPIGCYGIPLSSHWLGRNLLSLLTIMKLVFFPTGCYGISWFSGGLLWVNQVKSIPLPITEQSPALYF